MSSKATGARSVGLDAARGLAVVGMFIQHFGATALSAPVVSGNTTLLFVLCGGMAYAIMSRRSDERDEAAETFRSRMLSRSVFIAALGYLLILLNTPFGVILPAYAGLFVLALTLRNRSVRFLAWTAGALLFVAPVISVVGGALLPHSALWADVMGGPISAVALSCAFVTGMLLGRLNLARPWAPARLMAVGAGALAVGLAVGTWVLSAVQEPFERWLVSVQPVGAQGADEFAAWPMNTEQPLWLMLVSNAPHSASTVQTLAGIGFALVVLGLCQLLEKRAPVAFAPFALAGRVPLTLYAAQFVIIWVAGLAGIEVSLVEIPFGELIIAAVTIAGAWALTRRGSGPLETLMRRFDRLFTVGERSPGPRRPGAPAGAPGDDVRDERVSR